MEEVAESGIGRRMLDLDTHCLGEHAVVAEIKQDAPDPAGIDNRSESLVPKGARL